MTAVGQYASRKSQSLSTKLSKQPRDLTQLQELAGRYDANRLVRLPIEMPRSCIDRDDVVRIRSQSAFEKPVVRLMPNHAQFRQRVARKKTLDNFGDQLRVIAENVGVFLENRGRNPRLNQVGVHQLVDGR